MFISEKSETRENCFDFLRFFGAVLVIFTHSYALLNKASQEWMVEFTGGHQCIGGIAVHTFFIMSGFFITASWLHSKNIFDYFKKRILRLYPALAAVILISFFIVGPIFSDVPVFQYFLNPDTWAYLWNISVVKFLSTIPNVFTHNLYPNVFNGSLWTLRTELHCYLLVAALGLFGVYQKRWINLVLTIFLVAISALTGFHSNGLYFVDLFMIGQLFYIFRDKIYLDKFTFLILVFSLIFSLKHIHFYNMVNLIALPYIIIYFAYNFKYLNNFSKYGDFSYGMYIFAFPVQQIISAITGGQISIWDMFVFSSLITLLFAVLSWHFVEKKALSLKKIAFRQEIKCKFNRTLRNGELG